MKGVTVIMQQSQKKKNSKTASRHRNTVEYIASKSFLFISLTEKLDLTLFSVRISQYFISHTKSRSTQREYGSKLLIHSIIKRILVFKR